MAIKNGLIIGGAAITLGGFIVMVDSDKWLKRAYIGPDGFGVVYKFWTLKNGWSANSRAFSSWLMRMYFINDRSVLWFVIFIIDIDGTPAINMFVAPDLRAVCELTSFHFGAVRVIWRPPSVRTVVTSSLILANWQISFIRSLTRSSASLCLNINPVLKISAITGCMGITTSAFFLIPFLGFIRMNRLLMLV